MSPGNTDDRLRRLLALVPWVAAQDGPAVAEVCERFGYTEEELSEDLELLFMVGVHPFSPDTLIEADIADGRVWIRYADYFARPLRLTPPEALAIVAAGSALTAAPGADPGGPLASALAKLAAALGVDPDEAVDVELGEADEKVLPVLQQASESHHRVEISYYSFGRDEWTRRTIDPHRVFSSAGAWYVWGWCHKVDDDRLFRVDRVRDPSVLEETFEAKPGNDPPALYSARPDDPLYVLEVPVSERWIAEQYPHEALEELDGRLRISLRISERPWLERLLLRLGTEARVVEGDTDVARQAALRLLRRYGAGSLAP